MFSLLCFSIHIQYGYISSLMSPVWKLSISKIIIINNNESYYKKKIIWCCRCETKLFLPHKKRKVKPIDCSIVFISCSYTYVHWCIIGFAPLPFPPSLFLFLSYRISVCRLDYGFSCAWRWLLCFSANDLGVYTYTNIQKEVLKDLFNLQKWTETNFRFKYLFVPLNGYTNGPPFQKQAKAYYKGYVIKNSKEWPLRVHSCPHDLFCTLK